MSGARFDNEARAYCRGLLQDLAACVVLFVGLGLSAYFFGG